MPSGVHGCFGGCFQKGSWIERAAGNQGLAQGACRRRLHNRSNKRMSAAGCRGDAAACPWARVPELDLVRWHSGPWWQGVAQGPLRYLQFQVLLREEYAAACTWLVPPAEHVQLCLAATIAVKYLLRLWCAGLAPRTCSWCQADSTLRLSINHTHKAGCLQAPSALSCAGEVCHFQLQDVADGVPGDTQTRCITCLSTCNCVVRQVGVQ